MKPLLFLSPTTPVPAGHGLGMRAFAVLRALSRHHRVFLLVLNAPHGGNTACSALDGLCEEIAFQPAGLWKRRRERIRGLTTRWPLLHSKLFPLPCEWGLIDRTAFSFPFSCREFGLVHVFRAYLIPLLKRLQGSATWEKAQLDVDDLESAARRSLAAMHRLNGNRREAARLELEADGYDVLERKHIPRFDRVFACSRHDMDVFIETGLHPAPELLPNIAPAIARTSGNARQAAHQGLRLLFVGSLGYPPNSDAVRHFCREMLPHIRKRLSIPVSFDIVGGGLSGVAASEIRACPGAQLHGYVEDLTPFYDRADIVVAPLRAGGGTRIKILEAFSHGCPVVSTSRGIAGIEALDGVHALVEDSPHDFADACVRLHDDPGLKAKLNANAARLIRERHAEAVLDALFRPG